MNPISPNLPDIMSSDLYRSNLMADAANERLISEARAGRPQRIAILRQAAGRLAISIGQWLIHTQNQGSLVTGEHAEVETQAQ